MRSDIVLVLVLFYVFVAVLSTLDTDRTIELDSVGDEV